MNTQLCKYIFSKYYCNMFYHAGENKGLFTSAKFYSKKQYRMKNRFAFQNDLKKASLEYSESKVYSEQNDYDCEITNSNSTQGFVSADLLSHNETKSQRRTVLPFKAQTKKPTLTYQGEILFGVHPVHLALLQKKRTFYQLYTRKDVEDENVSYKREIIKLARTLNIPISYIDSNGLRILAPGAVHQGICLDAGFLPLQFWNEKQCNTETYENRPIWLILDEILDPMNVGAIIRSAYYFGVNRLFTVRGSSCKLSPTVSKASSGVLEVIDIYQIGNLEEFVKRRKDSGWSVVSTLASFDNESERRITPVRADQFNTSRPIILILGNEGKGIPENILNLCDSLISIKPGQVLPKGIDSLNVSVAAGVLLYILSNSKKET